MADVYLGLGSNLGDRLENLADALRRVGELPSTKLVAVSHVYESAAWGYAGAPDYANAVALIRTDLYADQLLELLKDIESDMGRAPADRNAPRVIDLDILIVGDEEWESPVLKIPHPQMAQRDFVITPLLELAPDLRYPDGTPVTRQFVSVGEVLGNLGVVPGFGDLAPHTAADEESGDAAARLSGYGRHDEWVVLEEVRRPSFEGDLHLQRLRAEGIPAELSTGGDTTFGGPYPGLPGIVQILVPRDRLEDARCVLADQGPEEGL